MGTYRYLRVTLIALLLTAGLGLSAVNAPPAGATSEVCQIAKNIAYVCIKVYGRGGYVNHVFVGGGLPTVPTSLQALGQVGRVCDNVTKVRISGNGNKYYRTYENRAPSGQCSLAGSYNIVPINQTFPKGFYVCTTFFIDASKEHPAGVQQGSEKCIKLT